jgi:rRNA processing protein Gar1
VIAMTKSNLKELGIAEYFVNGQLICLKPKFIPPQNSKVFLGDKLIGFVFLPFGRVDKAMLTINSKKGQNDMNALLNQKLMISLQINYGRKSKKSGKFKAKKSKR